MKTLQDDERVLKVMWRHPEADHEADGLQVWGGNGAVRVYEVADLADTIVMLMERCRPGVSLHGKPEPEQDVVIAGLLRRLWVAPPPNHPFRALAEMCERWAQQFEAARAAGLVPLDDALADVGLQLFTSLPRTAEREVLLCTDLHSGNVLAAEREPWLVIDPKPYVGDPTYDVIQHLLNCPGRLHADPEALVARIAGLLDLERERLRRWLFARCVQESTSWPALADVARELAHLPQLSRLTAQLRTAATSRAPL